jgi:hypothetical protein
MKESLIVEGKTYNLYFSLKNENRPMDAEVFALTCKHALKEYSTDLIFCMEIINKVTNFNVYQIEEIK